MRWTTIERNPQGGKLRFAYNDVGRTIYEVESKEAVLEGRHKLRFEFEGTGKPDLAHGKGMPGKGQLYVDGTLVGQGDIPLTNPISVGLLSALFCGADPGAPVTPKYKPPFAFSGRIYVVTIDVSGELLEDDESAVRMALARQ